jgi:phospholipase/carboxylesterase
METQPKTQIPFTSEKKPNGDIYLTPLDTHKYTLLWLHGLGDTAEGFIDFFFTAKPWLPNKNTKVIFQFKPELCRLLNL